MLARTLICINYPADLSDSSEIMSGNLVQYVVVRRDLVKVLKWPTGALIAQACHACTAVIHMFYQDENTKQYLADLDRMHKVILEVNHSPLQYRIYL